MQDQEGEEKKRRRKKKKRKRKRKRKGKGKRKREESAAQFSFSRTPEVLRQRPAAAHLHSTEAEAARLHPGSRRLGGSYPAATEPSGLGGERPARSRAQDDEEAGDTLSP